MSTTTTSPPPTVCSTLAVSSSSSTLTSSSSALLLTSEPKTSGLATSDQSQQQQQQPQRRQAPAPLFPSLFAGAAQAVLFNPVDRALYLRVHHREASFFSWSLWDRPFQGFTNAAVYRTVSGATYLYFQDWFRFCFEPGGVLEVPYARDNRLVVQACVGTAAGAANGWCLNGFQLVKYRIWSRGEGHFMQAALGIYRVGGAIMFFRGAGVSMIRDVSFGVSYEVLRTPGMSSGNENFKFGCNVLAGAAACVVSSPFNYCRNLVFGSSVRSSPLHVRRLLQFLWLECRNEPRPLQHLNARLNLGWGSLRVGLGIALGQLVYARVSKAME